MPDEGLLAQEDGARKHRTSNSEDEHRRTPRMRSLKKKAASASARITQGIKRCKQAAGCQFAAIAVDDIRDAEEVDAVNTLRQILIDTDLLPPTHDDYHTMLRFLKARKFDLDRTIHMWEEMIKWRKENRVDSIIQEKTGEASSGTNIAELMSDSGRVEDINPTRAGDVVEHIAQGSSQKLISHLCSAVDLALKLLSYLYIFLWALGERIWVRHGQHQARAPVNRQTSMSGPSSHRKDISEKINEEFLGLCRQRLQQLEVVVNDLSNKSSKIPPDKEEMILESLSRIKSIEHDLQKTKKTLMATASKQAELAESLETLEDSLHVS